MPAYIALNLVFTAALIVALALAGALRLDRSQLLTFVALFALTAVFDPLLVGFGIVRYDPATLLGLRIFGAPIEDFFYILATALVVPGVWRRLERGRTGGQA